MTDQRLIELAPKGVKCEIFERPPEHLGDFDRIVVTGTEGFSAVEMRYLSYFEPVIYSHSIQSKGEDRRHLFESASHFIALNPMHLERERQWVNLPTSKCYCIPPTVNPDDFHVGEKKDYVLWAHRNAYHKGLSKAMAWAKQRNLPIRVMYDVSKEEVAAAMAEARWFILLSTIFDAGPRAVIEAQLSGCELILDNVGYWDVSSEELRGLVNNAPINFWGVITE